MLPNKFLGFLLLGWGRCRHMRTVDGKNKDMQDWEDFMFLFAIPGHCLQIITQKLYLLVLITFLDLMTTEGQMQKYNQSVPW